MAAPDFPASPTVGQIYTAPSGAVYTWDGMVWYTAGSAQGAYWTDSGTTLSPTVATRQVRGGNFVGTGVSAAAGNDIVSGAPISATVKVHLGVNTDRLNLSTNRNIATGVADDTSKLAWTMDMGGAGDNFGIYRAPAGASLSWANVLTLDSAGNCTIPGKYFPVNLSVNSIAAVGLPASTNWVTQTNAWVRIATTPAMACRGGWIMMHATIGGYFTVNPTGASIYLGFGVDATSGPNWSYEYPIKSPVTANTQMPIPHIAQYWGSNAGSHTFSLWLYQVTNTAMLTGGSPGVLWAMEFA